MLVNFVELLLLIDQIVMLMKIVTEESKGGNDKYIPIVMKNSFEKDVFIGNFR